MDRAAREKLESTPAGTAASKKALAQDLIKALAQEGGLELNGAQVDLMERKIMTMLSARDTKWLKWAQLGIEVAQMDQIEQIVKVLRETNW